MTELGSEFDIKLAQMKLTSKVIIRGRNIYRNHKDGCFYCPDRKCKQRLDSEQCHDHGNQGWILSIGKDGEIQRVSKFLEAVHIIDSRGYVLRQKSPKRSRYFQCISSTCPTTGSLDKKNTSKLIYLQENPHASHRPQIVWMCPNEENQEKGYFVPSSDDTTRGQLISEGKIVLSCDDDDGEKPKACRRSGLRPKLAKEPTDKTSEPTKDESIHIHPASKLSFADIGGQPLSFGGSSKQATRSTRSLLDDLGTGHAGMSGADAEVNNLESYPLNEFSDNEDVFEHRHQTRRQNKNLYIQIVIRLLYLVAMITCVLYFGYSYCIHL